MSEDSNSKRWQDIEAGNRDTSFAGIALHMGQLRR